jgi:hypothetical protein
MINNRPFLLINYARSGGTLLNRMFGAYPNTIVLSEVNAKGCAYNPEGLPMPTVKDQIRNYYNIEIQNTDFAKAIHELNTIAFKTNKTLIIRDWTYIDFNPISLYNATPTYKLETLHDLNIVKPIPLALIRDTIDVWISHKCPDLDLFLSNYYKYLKELKKNKIKVFKYENLTTNPIKEFKKICQHLAIPFIDVSATYHTFNKVNGDSNKQMNSRGYDLKRIKQFKRKAIPLNKIKEINNHPLMLKCNKLFDYPTRYHKNLLQHLKFKYTFK